MSTDANPFADPEAVNPFADPSVQRVTAQSANAQKGLEDFNPFAGQQGQQPAGQARTANGPPASSGQLPPPPVAAAASQPAVMQATQQVQPPPYTPSPAQKAPGLDELQRRQEELEKKEAEIQRREEQLRQVPYNARQNNWPPLPAICPVKPCFYQDFNVDIPLEFQRIVKTIYYLWLFYVLTLVLNLIGAMAYTFTGGDAITLGLAILFLILFTPCSLICWYRPIYKAFRSDSSFNFFLFFFVFFFQFVICVIQAVGIDSFGTCGFINGLGAFSRDGSKAQAYAVGGIMLVVAFMFAMTATVGFYCLVKVHRIYRSTGASFEKAQAEFASGIMSNPNVQNAAANAASTAARSAATGAMQGNRY